MRGEAVAVYVTFPDLGVAEGIGTQVVEAGLAACANLIPGMRSVYRWQGRVERAEEVVGILKTTRARVPALIAAIEAAHPYETPAIVVLPIESGSAGYLAWIAAETADAAGETPQSA